MGRKTTMVVRVEEVIAPLTCEVPCMAASFTDIPVSRSRKIFSMTTMALSTSIPAPSASPPKVMIFRLRPLKYIRLKVAMIETGMDMLTIMVVPIRRRKRNTTKMASVIPIKEVFSTSLMALLMKIPWFETTVILYPGKAFSMVARVFVISSTAFTVLKLVSL